MTEDEWEGGAEPAVMLRAWWAGGRPSNRRLRLVVCGCCRLLWDALSHPASRGAVEVAERFADGEATAVDRDEARWALWPTRGWDHRWRPQGADRIAFLAGDANAKLKTRAEEAAAAVVNVRLSQECGPEFQPHRAECWTRVRSRERGRVCDLLRDLVAYPFGRPAYLPAEVLSWERGLIADLAAAAYRDRSPATGRLDNARLAVLADALEEVGCPEAALLMHLRSPRPHWRGCFALDAVLGKA